MIFTYGQLFVLFDIFGIHIKIITLYLFIIGFIFMSDSEEKNLFMFKFPNNLNFTLVQFTVVSLTWYNYKF